MLNYIISFFRPGLLFNMRPSSLEGTGLYILLGLFGAIFVLGILAAIFLRKYHGDKLIIRGLKKIESAFITIGILGLAYTWTAYEGVAVLSARIWFLVLVAGLIIWLFFPLWYLVAKMPRIREEIKRKKEFEKYLP